MQTSNIDLELDAAKRELNAAFDNFVARVHVIQKGEDDIRYPDDYTADEFVNDFMECYYDYRPD